MTNENELQTKTKLTHDDGEGREEIKVVQYQSAAGIETIIFLLHENVKSNALIFAKLYEHKGYKSFLAKHKQLFKTFNYLLL